MADVEQKLREAMLAYKQVAMSPEGQIMVADLLGKFGWSRQSMFTGDALQLAFREGQRTVLVHMGRMIDGDPNQYGETHLKKGKE